MLLDGIFLPLTTPFHPDGRLSLRKLEGNVDRYSRTPAAGMLVLGRTGETTFLTDVEARQTLEAAIGAASKEKVMLAGVGRESVFATLEIAEVAARAGYDAVVVEAPLLLSDAAIQRELLVYFQAVADRSPLPVILANDSDVRLPLGPIAELANHPQVIGLIDRLTSAERLRELAELTAGVSREVTVTTVFGAVTNRMLRQARPGASLMSAQGLQGGGTVTVAPPAAQVLKTRTKKVGFQVLAGSAAGMLEAWRAGAAGGVPRMGACAPQACCEIWQAFRDGDLLLAEEKQARIQCVAGMTEGWSGIAAIKYGCDFNGYFGGRPRLPLLPLNEGHRKALEAALAGMRN
jgi:4-hydroxy-2-oxoglutarate aldolase